MFPSIFWSFSNKFSGELSKHFSMHAKPPSQWLSSLQPYGQVLDQCYGSSGSRRGSATASHGWP